MASQSTAVSGGEPAGDGDGGPGDAGVESGSALPAGVSEGGGAGGVGAADSVGAAGSAVRGAGSGAGESDAGALGASLAGIAPAHAGVTVAPKLRAPIRSAPTAALTSMVRAALRRGESVRRSESRIGMVALQWLANR
jgi:hypothetical protein